MKEISLDDLLAGRSGKTQNGSSSARAQAPALPRSTNLGRARPVTAIPATRNNNIDKKNSESKGKAKPAKQKVEILKDLLTSSKIKAKKSEAKHTDARSKRTITPSKSVQKATKSPIKRSTSSSKTTARGKSLILGKRKSAATPSK